MSIQFEPQLIPDIILVKPTIFKDTRGFSSEAYKQSSYVSHISAQFVQDNHSRSTKGVLRGLHYQLEPKAQGKLVSVIQGEIIDVAVDVRKGSPTYGQSVQCLLSDVNQHQLYVPEGFAHGFVVLSNVADVYYKLTNEYSATHARGIAWNDPSLNIDWQITEPILSEQDKHQPRLEEADNNFTYPQSNRKGRT